MATSQFVGTLHYVMNGMTKESFIQQTDAAGNITSTLLIRDLPASATLMQQIAAATGYFAGKNEGTPISINGNLVPVGASQAIQF